jgi:hypothetical protein
LLVQKPQNRLSVIISGGSTTITTNTILVMVKKGIQDIVLVVMKRMRTSMPPGDITNGGHTAFPSQDHPAPHPDGREDLHRRIEVAAHIPPMGGSAQDHLIEASEMRERSEE